MSTTDFTNGVTLTDAGWFDDVDCVGYSVLSGVAGTNTITATGPATYTYAATRPPVWFTPAVTNSGATTINITPSGGSSLGAKDVFCNGAACVGGELVAGVATGLIYDGTQFNIVGPRTPATQAQQEAATVTGLYVSPARQHFHPSAAKAWIKHDITGGIQASYNITSITDDGGGLVTVTIANDFSSEHYAIIGTVLFNGGVRNVVVTSQAAGTFAGRANSSADAASDPTNWYWVCFGDL